MSLLSRADIITYLSFFFIDIVGLSDPLVSTNTQVSKIKTLNRAISQCTTFLTARKDEVLGLPTGDGIAIGFSKGLEKPLLLARELHLILNEYNQEKPIRERVFVRIGCNDGHVFIVNDVYGNLNVWGPGIVLARRVMDLGDAGHILMTSTMAESLIELSEVYKEMIHLVDDFRIKHGADVLIYSVYGKNFGNPKKPEKGLSTNIKTANIVKEVKDKIIYRKIEFNYVLGKPNANLIRHTKKCYIYNSGLDPVFLLGEVITGVDKPLSDINLRLFDENNTELRISSITSETPMKKEFTIKFSQPILPRGGLRMYGLSYETEESQRYIIQSYERECEELNIIFEYPQDITLEPKLVHLRNKQETILVRDVLVRSSGRYIVRWKKRNGILEGDTTRLEW